MKSRAHTVELRPVRVTDCELLWEWANDPVTRQASLSSCSITWEQHQTWLLDKVKDPQSRFYMALDEDIPIGQIRFDFEGREAVVSVNLAAEYRGLGYGPLIIQLGVEVLFRETSVAAIYAYIKPSNMASIKAFMKAGFTRRDRVILQGQSVFRFVLRKERGNEVNRE